MNENIDYKSATLNEIMSQPVVWQAQLAELREGALVDSILDKTSSRTEWLFLGCGTSYYLAEAAAASWTLLTGQRARALPASEPLLFSELAYLKSPNLQTVLISRSGETSETVRAAKLLSELRLPTLGITCATSSALQRACDQTIRVLCADEKSVVMTRSFTTMLLTLQHLAARKGNQEKFIEAQLNVAQHFSGQISALCMHVEEFAKKYAFNDFVFLGQGPFHAIAREAALKVMEMSCSYSQVFHTLEFRHGPKAIVSPQTCLTFFLGQTVTTAESELLGEMKELGGVIFTVCHRATDVIRNSSDLLIELDFAAPELATLLPFIVPAQLLGFFTGIKKNLNPDEPKNLSRVVMLD